MGETDELAARAMASSPVGTAIVRDGRYVFVNAAFGDAAGHPAGALIGQDAFFLVAPEEREGVRARHAARLRGDPLPPQYEVTVIAANGEPRRVEIEPRALSETVSIVVARALGERAQDHDLLRALGSLQARVQRERSVAAVLKVAVEGLRALGFGACVGQLAGDECVMVASAFRQPLDELVGLAASRGGRIALPLAWIPNIRQAITEQVPLFRDDAIEALQRLAARGGVSDGRVARIREALGIRQVALSPITVRGRGWGVLLTFAERLRSNDAAALALFASQVASSIEVARSIEELEAIHQLASLGAELDQDALIRRALPILQAATRSDAAAIFLNSPDRGELALAGAIPDGSCPTDPGWLPATPADHGLSVADAPAAFQEELKRLGHQKLAVVPLAVAERRGGSLVLSRRGPVPYSDDELRSARMLAAQAALQLERARLYEDARRRVDVLSRLNDLGATIARHLALDEVFAVGLRQASEIVSVSNTFVLLLDETGSFIRIVAANVDFEPVRQVQVPLNGASAAAEAIRTLAPVMLADAQIDTRAARKLADYFGHRALLAVPLMSEGKALGALVLGETRSRRAFNSDEVDRAVAVANQLATAIVNARLYEDLRRSYEALTRTQQELVKRERLAALGELSAQVAHEVRNPLGVIFNSLASLKRLDPGSADARGLLALMAEEAERLNRMVNDLLDFAGPTSARLRPEPLDTVLSGALEAATRALPSPRVHLELTVSTALPKVPIDARLLRQAVLNLVVNAMQAMPEGGTVRVRASRVEREGRPVARLDVQDDGPGMADNVAARAFEPFFTTRAAGTGLGLAVVKRIADAHGAEVSLQTAPGKGATFTLFLPLS